VKQIISAQQARRLVTDTGWRLMQRGYETYSRNMRWVVYQAGHLYMRRPCSPYW
jgi:hypothetical protein